MNWKKITKRTLIITGSLLLLVFLAAFIVVRFYEDGVIKYAIGRINTHLKTQARYETVDLTLWKSFPDASIRFTNVYVEETFTEKDTLLFTEKLFLSFNLFDLFRGSYEVNEIEAIQAKAYLKLDEKGNDNWHFWKEKENADTGKFSLALQHVILENVSVVYEDRRNKFFLDLTSSSSAVHGDFGNSEFELALDFHGVLHSLVSGGTEYAAGRQLQAEAEISANTSTQLYGFSQCKLALDGLPFTLSGDVDASENSKLNLLVKGEKLELEEVIEKLPGATNGRLKNYEPSGLITTSVSIYGETSEGKRPEVVADFSLRDGSLKQRESGVALSAMDCSGNYKSLRKSHDKLQIDKLSGMLGGGAFEATGWIENLADPQTHLAMKANLDLYQLKQFFRWDTLEVCEGRITADATVAGKIVSLPDSSFDLAALNIAGNARLENAHLKLEASSREFKNVEGTFLLNNADASVQNLKGEVNGTHFEVNGTLGNIVRYLQRNDEELVVDASFSSPHVDFSRLIENHETRKSDDYKFVFPQNIRFLVNADLGKFSFGKFEATGVKGIARLNGNRLSVDPVSFHTADGTFVSRVMLDRQNEDQFMLRSFSNLADINIQKLFTEFDNFGQHTIMDNHLRGRATATVKFDAPVSSSLRIVQDKIECLADVKIENGRLIALESLQDIATYIRKNKLVAPFVNEDRFAEKMKDISFSTFENVIEVKNSTVTFPIMEVRTTAMDISARGTHYFDQRIDYTVGFNLRDILIRKEKEIAEMDDGLGRQLFIYMKGTVQNPEFGLDKQAAKENRQQEMFEEKQNIKALLKEEFGLFKKEQGLPAYREETTTQGTTTVVWEEAVKQNEPLPKKEEPIKKTETAPATESKKKKLPKWLQEKEETEDE